MQPAFGCVTLHPQYSVTSLRLLPSSTSLSGTRATPRSPYPRAPVRAMDSKAARERSETLVAREHRVASPRERSRKETTKGEQDTRDTTISTRPGPASPRRRCLECPDLRQSSNTQERGKKERKDEHVIDKSTRVLGLASTDRSAGLLCRGRHPDSNKVVCKRFCAHAFDASGTHDLPAPFSAVRM